MFKKKSKQKNKKGYLRRGAGFVGREIGSYKRFWRPNFIIWDVFLQLGEVLKDMRNDTRKAVLNNEAKKSKEDIMREFCDMYDLDYEDYYDLRRHQYNLYRMKALGIGILLFGLPAYSYLQGNYGLDNYIGVNHWIMVSAWFATFSFYYSFIGYWLLRSREGRYIKYRKFLSMWYSSPVDLLPFLSYDNTIEKRCGKQASMFYIYGVGDGDDIDKAIQKHKINKNKEKALKRQTAK